MENPRNSKKNKRQVVFAAANGYSGFRSYFQNVFSPLKNDRLYIIKGGPGTGKNKLMRRIADSFGNGEYSITEVLCSSDPDSLDGVRLSDGKRSVGILDGTAPHATDAAFPTLVERYVDVGKNLDYDKLKPKKNEILYLSKEKKKYYDKAYQYLALSGVIHRNILAEYQTDVSYKTCFEKGKNVGFDLDTGENESNVYLISAFCKLGKITLPSEKIHAQTAVHPVGNTFAKAAFMKGVEFALRERNRPFIRYSSPFSDEETEAILLTENSLLISAVHQKLSANDQTVLLPDIASEQIRESVSALSEIENEIKVKAASALAIASERHFEMEHIFSSAMDFPANDSIAESLISEIGAFFKE